MKTIRSLVLVLSVVFSVQSWAAELPDFTGLVKTLSPAVVNISTINDPDPNQGGEGSMRGPNGEEIPELCRDFCRRFQRPGGAPRANPQSLASAYIISNDGHVLTNHHGVDGPDNVRVRLDDRRAREAVVIGSDLRSDVA